MKLIAGLGNPGRSYAEHKHNIGFCVLDLLACRHNIDVRKRSFGALVGSGAFEGEAVLLAKPQTFMNISGDAIAPLLRYYRMEPQGLVVVHDDIDLNLGRLKIAFGAGHGGHNGVRSIIDAVGSNEFYRVRVGVGRPLAGMDAADYVLHPFPADEKKPAEDAVRAAADAVEMLLLKGLETTQQKYH